jgi:hypothetical protein
VTFGLRSHCINQTRDHELPLRFVEAAASRFGTEIYPTQTLDAWVNNTPTDAYARLARFLFGMGWWMTVDPVAGDSFGHKRRRAREVHVARCGRSGRV